MVAGVGRIYGRLAWGAGGFGCLYSRHRYNQQLRGCGGGRVGSGDAGDLGDSEFLLTSRLCR